ncbi:hypothetical protein H7I53_20820 [Mycolicibacterium pulveris]|uniref:Uncharacterized protein n=1 Tax=Mycolicibacterium pulveris TaxID=36813 RepID=A0A7I7UJZ3_MYCPV|nr:hypothetical protein [Mycolicibacterium pulveris]MCV6982655.1 hypothetical protein [Mycolicibacterium pulveris]BBY80416.1 hypothetical protein MPUL_15740 [Mycolicibacterium pulveris]
MSRLLRLTLLASAALAVAAPGAGISAAQHGSWCAPVEEYQIEVLEGDVNCTDAYYVAQAYDIYSFDEEQYLYEYICYDASVPPAIFKCESQTAWFAVHSS